MSPRSEPQRLPSSPRQELRPRQHSTTGRPSTLPPVLGRPRWSGSTAAALVHAAFALSLAVMIIRQPGGATSWEGWALLTPAVVVLAGQGRPWTRWPLLVQGAVLTGVAALTLTDTMTLPGGRLTADFTASLAVCQVALAALALQTAGALGRRG